MIKKIFFGAVIWFGWCCVASEQMKTAMVKKEYKNRINVLYENGELSPADLVCAQAYEGEIRREVIAQLTSRPGIKTRRGLEKTDRMIIAMVKNRQNANSQALKEFDAKRAKKPSQLCRTNPCTQEASFNPMPWGSKALSDLRPLQHIDGKYKWIE